MDGSIVDGWADCGRMETLRAVMAVLSGYGRIEAPGRAHLAVPGVESDLVGSELTVGRGR